MFYSHQLLARKAPLGQIWMAATMHAKINRKKLDKLNIIKICEQILNPSVPMALRLSGILMGGVVIVYERKVKLLYDDVTRLLVEINEAWKVKAAPDPTVLAKGKNQAKYQAVTLPDNQEADLGEIEQSLQHSNASTMMGFQQTTYIAMQLDTVDEPYLNPNPQEENLSHQYHQADADNITSFERYNPFPVDTYYNRYERFDIEGDEETHLNFSQENTQIPSTLIPSPPLQEEPQKPDEILEQHHEDQINQQSDGGREANQLQDKQRQGSIRRKARRPAAFAMDYEQTVIPGHMYQSWLQNASDIFSKRGRKRKQWDAMSSMKKANLMELPPVVLICGLFANGSREIHYPAPILELWTRSTPPPLGSTSGRTSPNPPPKPSSSSPTEIIHYQDPLGFPFEDFQSGVGSHSMGVSIEKQRENVKNDGMPPEIFMEELSNNIMNNGVKGTEANLMVTPGNSGDEVRSIPSSGSRNGILSHNSDVNSGRSNSNKRPYTASRTSGSGLEPVAEEYAWQHPDPNFKLAKLSENCPTPDYDLLVETGPTQTQQHRIINQPIDQITDSICVQLKAHFDTSGSPKVESLNQLAFGMNKKRAAHLFYQTCVLATRDCLRVEQKVPYGDILISRGTKM